MHTIKDRIKEVEDEIGSRKESLDAAMRAREIKFMPQVYKSAISNISGNAMVKGKELSELLTYHEIESLIAIRKGMLAESEVNHDCLMDILDSESK